MAYIGPADLSMSLSISIKFNYTKFTKAIEMVLDEAKAAGVAPGIHCKVEEGFPLQLVSATKEVKEVEATGLRSCNLYILQVTRSPLESKTIFCLKSLHFLDKE